MAYWDIVLKWVHLIKKRMKDTDFEVDMEGAIPKFRTHSPGWNNGYLLPVLSVEAEREFNERFQHHMDKFAAEVGIYLGEVRNES